MDKYIGVIAVILTFSSGLSFLSILTPNKKIETWVEKWGDCLLICSLTSVLGIILLMSLNFF